MMIFTQTATCTGNDWIFKLLVDFSYCYLLYWMWLLKIESTK